MTKDPDTSPTFAFVTLPELKIPTASRVEAALKEYLADGVVISDLSIDEKSVTFYVDGKLVMFAYMDVPIPWGDLEGPCATSWVWPEATQQMKGHKAHLIVTLLGQDGSQIDRCLLLTRLLAAACKAFDATGIYWGYGCVVLDADRLQRMAADSSRDNLPLLAWIEFRVQKNPDKTINVLTTGLDYFRCREIEVIESKSRFEDIMDAVMGVATITLQGDVIKDGDTIGPDDSMKIRVRHRDSQWDRKGKVLRLEM